MRARSGVGRLALEVPEAHVSCVAVTGTADLTGFPRRPQIKVRFFDPAGGQPRADEDPAALSARLLARSARSPRRAEPPQALRGGLGLRCGATGPGLKRCVPGVSRRPARL